MKQKDVIYIKMIECDEHGITGDIYSTQNTETADLCTYRARLNCASS